MNVEIGYAMIIIGIGLMVAEAMHPGFFVAVPGTVLLVMGAVFVLLPGVFEQWSALIMIITALLASIATIMLYRRIAPVQKPSSTSMDSIIGKKGLVTIDIEPGSISGKVKISNQMWSATSESPIPAGRNVEVTGSEGVHVTVVESIE
ncbi:MAG: NfeD family protein [ANME-2 cluster archaeon]|nr:NfeD family protein [ANME-2 cluster archaeon]MDF1558290.1 NfeD family protein [ANME-2 cluster archaeon]